MFNIDSFQLDLAYSPVYFFIGAVLIFLYSFYVYRKTVPPIRNFTKWSLIFIRFIALVFILLLIFAPNLTLTTKENISPKKLVFFDNSTSVVYKDSIKYKSMLDSIKTKLENSESDFSLFSFGSDVNNLEQNKLEFREPVTNIQNVFGKIAEIENVSSALIISDGIVNEGSQSLSKVQSANIPIDVLGIGDTAKRKDIRIGKIEKNEFIYANTKTNVEVSVITENLLNGKFAIQLMEGSKQIQTKYFKANSAGITNVEFEYTPKTKGEKRFRINIPVNKEEENQSNNSKDFYINVLDDKIEITLLAGEPSSDLSILKQVLLKNDKVEVNEIIEISNNKYLGSNYNLTQIDSADILFLIGFPSENSSNNIIQKTLNYIKNEKPFFISFSNGISFSKLRSLENHLPFSFNTRSMEFEEISANINENSILSEAFFQENSIENLPPIFRNLSKIKLKPTSQSLVNSSFENITTSNPFIIAGDNRNQKSICFLGKGFWRWKLMTAKSKNFFLENFINKSVSWLNTPSGTNRFMVETSKKIFSRGEQIEFEGKVFDELFNPMQNVKISVEISNQESDKKSLTMEPTSEGSYTGTIDLLEKGDYNYTAEIRNSENKFLKRISGKFSVSELEIEKLENKMNKLYLEKIAVGSNGEFATEENWKSLVNNFINKYNAYQTVYNSSEYKLWNNYYFLISIILLFSIEWFIRKRIGMQ